MEKVSKIKLVLMISVTLLFLAILGIPSNVFGASADINSNVTKMQVNESASITASVASCEAWDLKLSANGGNLSGSTASADAPGEEVSRGVMTATFTASTPGTYTITLSGAVTGSDLVKHNVSRTTTINVIEEVKEEPQQPEQPSEPEQPSTPNTPTVVKSSDAGLSSLTAQANGKSLDVSQSSTKYSATVEADVTAVTFTVKANSSSASIDSNKSTSGIGFVKNSGSGSQKTYTMSSLKEGINVIRITITAEDGTERNYTFTVTKKVTENNIETSLLPNIVEDVPPTEENTEEQENTEEKTEEVGFGLKTLIITGVEISPEFNTSTYEYTAIIEGSDSVEVIALPTEEGATVEIVGNTNLVSGENLITVLVKKDDEVKTYQIILTKTDATPTSTETTDDNTIFLGLTWKHIAIIAAAVLVVIAIVIKLVFLSKTTVEDDEPYDYGKKEKKEKKEKKKNNKDVSDNIYYNDENSKKGRRFK